jgi:hypothetical protein
VVDEAEAGIYKIHRVRLSESIQSSLQRACVVRDVKAAVLHTPTTPFDAHALISTIVPHGGQWGNHSILVAVPRKFLVIIIILEIPAVAANGMQVGLVEEDAE